MSKQPNPLSDLRLSALPSINLLTRSSWRAVSKLPKQPGIYTVICDVVKRETQATACASLRSAGLNQAAVKAMGTTQIVQQVTNIVNRGSLAQLCLYIGMSGNLHKRWNGSSQHHKLETLRLMSHLLNTLFKVVSLRLHYGLTSSRELALQVETELIRLWKPLSNGKKALV